MDDAHLLRRYSEQGSEAAFSELVGRHLNLVHSAAMRQVGGDYHRAKDVTQVVFTLLARKAGSLTRHATLTGWLYSTTLYSAKTVMRGEKRRKIREEETYHMNELPANPEPEVDWYRLRPVLDRVMLELNEREREAILWRFFDAMPLVAMGEKMGINASGAKKRVDRALDKMCVSFARRGATSTTAAMAAMLAEHAVVAAPAGLAETIAATALGSAAGAGAQASWLLKFLGKAKLTVGVSGAMWLGSILAISALGVAAYELWMAGHFRAALTQEGQDYAAQQEHLRALERAVTHLAATPLAKSAIATRDPKVEFGNFLAAYPKARAEITAQLRVLIAEEYGSFFRSAGLTPSQIDQFENVVADAFLGRMTFTPDQFVSGPKGLPEDQVRAILGGQAYQEIQDYALTLYAHFWAGRVARVSFGASISPDQVDQLAQILVNNNPAPPIRFRDGLSTLASIDWDQVLIQAKSVFLESQWSAVEPALLDLQARTLGHAQQFSNSVGHE